MCPDIRTRFARAVMRFLIATVVVASIAVPAAGQTLGGGDAHTVILKPDGSVWAMGNNTYGQLGDSSCLIHRNVGRTLM